MHGDILSDNARNDANYSCNNCVCYMHEKNVR